MRLAELISARLHAKTGLDVYLESMVFSEAVHISHALNATLFGPLTEPAAFLQLKYWIGRHLNFHRNFNRQFSASWLENESREAIDARFVPAIPLFEFDKTIPMQEILEDSSLGSVRDKGRGLYARLAKLPPNERAEEVEKLKTAFRARTRRASGLEITLDVGDTGMSAVDLIIGIFVPPLSAIRRLAKPWIEKARRNRKIDSMIMDLEDKMRRTPETRELEFLSRVSRVASFKADRV